VAIHALDHRGVEADAGGEHEVAPARPAQVDAEGLELVGHPQQVLGGVDHVVGDSQRARPDVGRPARQGGQRRLRPDQPVGGLVDGAVAAERHHHVVALAGGLARDLRGVVALLGVDRLDRVARLERVDDQVAQPVRDRGRVRIDDHQHAPLGRAVRQEALG
jgi:hypothetical protein